MAIYHLHAKTVSRSRGQSAVASAAYRSGEKLLDERIDKEFDYTRRETVIHTEIITPANAPEWAKNRQALWNEVERSEKRKDAQLAREIEIALPHELSRVEQIECAKEFIQGNFVNRGMIADVCIHEKEFRATDEHGNEVTRTGCHAHIMLTTRTINNDEFGQKAREWNDKELCNQWREQWAETANRHLKEAGLDVSIDHRSYAEQGINLEGQNKIGKTPGPDVTADRMAEHQRITRENGERIIKDSSIATDHLTHNQSVFTRADIYKYANTHSADPEQFDRVANSIFQNHELVNLGRGEDDKERLTTKNALENERRMIGNAGEMSDIRNHLVRPVNIESARASRSMTPEQNAAFDHILQSGDCCAVVGFAGTGKSYTLGAVREAYEKEGYRVKGAALSGIAAEGLQQSAGIESQTIHRRIWDIQNGRNELTSRDVLVIDEAGMVGTRQMNELISHAREKGAKVVLVGDDMQLQPIEAGAAFRGIREEVGAVEMSAIRRQDQEWQREATKELNTNRPAEALDRYQAAGNIQSFETQAQAKEALVSDWKTYQAERGGQGSAMMQAYRRVDVEELNAAGREVLKEKGFVAQDGRTFETIKGEREFAGGDRLMFLKNDRGLDVKNGNLGTVERIEGNQISVRLDNGKKVSFDASQYKDFNHGYAATVHKLQGATIDRSFVLADRIYDRHSTLTAMSRHREDAGLYWSKEQFKDFGELRAVMGRAKSKELVKDYAERRGIEPEGLNGPERKIEPIREKEPRLKGAEVPELAEWKTEAPAQVIKKPAEVRIPPAAIIEARDQVDRSPGLPNRQPAAQERKEWSRPARTTDQASPEAVKKEGPSQGGIKARAEIPEQSGAKNRIDPNRVDLAELKAALTTREKGEIDPRKVDLAELDILRGGGMKPDRDRMKAELQDREQGKKPEDRERDQVTGKPERDPVSPDLASPAARSEQPLSPEQDRQVKIESLNSQKADILKPHFETAIKEQLNEKLADERNRLKKWNDDYEKRLDAHNKTGIFKRLGSSFNANANALENEHSELKRAAERFGKNKQRETEKAERLIGESTRRAAIHFCNSYPDLAKKAEQKALNDPGSAEKLKKVNSDLGRLNEQQKQAQLQKMREQAKQQLTLQQQKQQQQKGMSR